MKSLRYLAALLLILTGVLHMLAVFMDKPVPYSWAVFVFGIIYFTVGVLLIANTTFSTLLGVVFPLIGLGTGVFMIGLKNWTVMLDFLFFVDAIVAICCFAILLRRNK